MHCSTPKNYTLSYKFYFSHTCNLREYTQLETTILFVSDNQVILFSVLVWRCTLTRECMILLVKLKQV